MSKEIREDLIGERRVMEPEKGKIETYVKCKIHEGWFIVETENWEEHLAAYHRDDKPQ